MSGRLPHFSLAMCRATRERPLSTSVRADARGKDNLQSVYVRYWAGMCNLVNAGNVP